MDSGHINKSDSTLPMRASTLDVDQYLPDVRTDFVSEEDAREFLRLFANILCAFVDLGWGVDSIHFACPEFAQISSEVDGIGDTFDASAFMPPESESP